MLISNVDQQKTSINANLNLTQELGKRREKERQVSQQKGHSYHSYHEKTAFPDLPLQKHSAPSLSMAFTSTLNLSAAPCLSDTLTPAEVDGLKGGQLKEALRTRNLALVVKGDTTVEGKRKRLRAYLEDPTGPHVFARKTQARTSMTTVSSAPSTSAPLPPTPVISASPPQLASATKTTTPLPQPHYQEFLWQTCAKKLHHHSQPS